MELFAEVRIDMACREGKQTPVKQLAESAKGQHLGLGIRGVVGGQPILRASAVGCFGKHLLEFTSLSAVV